MASNASVSRRRMLGILGCVAVAHVAVIVTAERAGPGSAQLREQVLSAAPEPTAAPAVRTAAPPIATSVSTAIPTVAPPTATTAPPTATSAPPTAVAAPPASTATAAPAAASAEHAYEAPTAATPTARPVAAAPPQPTAPAKPKASVSPTQTMPGGRNNYVANAPLVANLGKGFIVDGRVVDIAGEPVKNTRVQIWFNSARGGEREPSNRGSVITDELGKYRLETSPVVPVFGQPHVHIGYDDGKFGTLFLRPVLKTEKDPSITVDFVLGPP